MPVRSLNSSVMKWPNKDQVLQALKNWKSTFCNNNKNIISIGYFGSYARNDSGVGSDLDLVIIVKKTDKPFEKRSTEWDLSSIPVPVDLLVYTQKEWRKLKRETNKFIEKLLKETIWLK
ncbi:MAG: nucleotidyltransferase domain-containing protein [Kosmotoga sp.]|nr:MAG: nucleotidyltransferase domain-containing protein [Kosmotoga sp.]